MTIGEKIKIVRKKSGLTQDEFAKKLFVSRSAVSKWERNIGYPNIESIKDISKEFNISMNELLNEEELFNISVLLKKDKIHKLKAITYTILDVLCFIIMFLPVFSLQVGERFISVTLFNHAVNNGILNGIYFVVFCIFLLMAVTTQIIHNFPSLKKYREHSYKLSFVLSIGTLFLFIVTNEIYITSFIALFLLVKGAVLFYIKK